MARFATPEVFYAAAMRILAGPGLPGLRIGTLCREVGVTSGSFYHHFGNWDGFVSALLAHWTDDHVHRIIALVRREQDPLVRVELMKRMGLAVPHASETAIRSWAATDDVVAAAQQQVDERRREALREVLVPLVGDDVAGTLAEVGLSLLIGHQQVARGPGGSGPPVELAALFDQFELLVRHHAGEPPAARALSG